MRNFLQSKMGILFLGFVTVFGLLTYFWKNEGNSIDITTGEEITSAEKVQLLEEKRNEAKSLIEQLVPVLLDIRVIGGSLALDGIIYKNNEYLLYTTGETTYKIGLDLYKE